jgi:hypothetical protein
LNFVADSRFHKRELRAAGKFAEEFAMDALMVFGTIVFFAVAILYTMGCDKLK